MIIEQIHIPKNLEKFASLTKSTILIIQRKNLCIYIKLASALAGLSALACSAASAGLRLAAFATL